MKTRREFLVRAPGLALGAALAPSALAWAGVPAGLRVRRVMRTVHLDELSCATFVPLVNSHFTIDLDERESRGLILANIREEPRLFNSEGAELETFSLLFWDASTVRFPQKTY